MSAPARVLHAERDGVHHLRVSGELRYVAAAPILHLVDELFEAGPVLGFAVDLREASFLDSTCLGLLAHIALLLKRSSGGRLVLVGPPPDVAVVLDAMGFGEVADIGAGPDPLGAVERSLPAGPTGAEELGRTVLATHRALLALSPKNEAGFREVVRALEAEVGESAPQG